MNDNQHTQITAHMKWVALEITGKGQIRQIDNGISQGLYSRDPHRSMGYTRILTHPTPIHQHSRSSSLTANPTSLLRQYHPYKKENSQNNSLTLREPSYMCDWKEEQHRKRVASSLPSQPPIHHPFHHTDSHIPHFHYLRRMVLLGLPRLIADCRDSLFNPPQLHPKCSTITLVCNTECKKDSNMTRNDESHESRFTRHEP